MQNQQTNKSKLKANLENEIKSKIATYELDNFSYLFFSKIKNILVNIPDNFFNNFLYLKTQGNPLMALDLIENLIK